MDFHEGDPVVHWTYGLGQVIQLEERAVAGATTLYYAVKMKDDLTVWVPADAKLASRLRPPTSQSAFKRLMATLSQPGEPLPDDRHERRTRLLALLKDGRAESLFRVIRGLFAYRKVRALNDHDQTLLRHTQNILLGEWGYVLSVTHNQAEDELHRLLTSGTAGD